MEMYACVYARRRGRLLLPRRSWTECARKRGRRTANRSHQVQRTDMFHDAVEEDLDLEALRAEEEAALLATKARQQKLKELKERQAVRAHAIEQRISARMSTIMTSDVNELKRALAKSLLVIDAFKELKEELEAKDQELKHLQALKLQVRQLFESATIKTGEKQLERMKGKLRILFDRADLDHDGTISVKEMILSLRKDEELAEFLSLPTCIKKCDGSAEKFRSMFVSMDGNKDYSINFDEFVAFARGGAGSSELAAALRNSK